MTYNITKLIADLGGVLHGTTINQITNSYGVYNRAASQLLLDLDPMETVRNVPFASVIYNGIYDYEIPVDVKGNSILDIIPQVNRNPWDTWSQGYLQSFDLWKQNAQKNGFAVDWNEGVKTIRIDAPFLPVPVSINLADQVSDNGTWVAGGDATNLTSNQTDFVASSSSLQFDLTGSTGIGYLENSTMAPVNLSTVVNQATQFLSTFLPTGNQFSSVNLRFGSDASDYYSVTASLNQQGNAFINGWNLVGFPWLGSTVVGTPNPSAITYVRVTWNYGVGEPQTSVLLNNITSNLGMILNCEYYSKYMFADATTGAFKENVTSVTDKINLDTDAYAIYFNLVAYLAMQQQQGLDAAFYDGNFFLTAYQQGLAKYKQRYPSQTQKAQTVYYNPTRGGSYYNRLGGHWYGR